MSDRRILIACPIHRNLEPCFLPGLQAVLSNRYDGIDVKFQLCVGLPVNFARNYLAGHAKTIGAREILFIDSDMGWEEEDFVRICLHKDVDIVGGLYCRKQPGRPHYHVNLIKGNETDGGTGLEEVEAIATGFLKIRVDTVLPAIEAKFPERAYDNNGGGFEYFPMGVVSRTLLGEDYFFCRLARECGFKVYADFQARIIPHWGAVPFPLTLDMVAPEDAA